MIRGLRRRVLELPVPVRAVLGVTVLNRLANVVQPFIVLYCVQRYGWTDVRASLAMTWYGAGALGATLLGGVATDYCGARRVLLCSYVGTLIGVAALAAGPSAAWLPVVIAVCGCCIELVRPPISTLLSHYLSGAALVRVYSLHHIMINLGFMIAPLLGSALIGYGFPALYAGSAGLIACSFLVTWRLIVDAQPIRIVRAQAAAASSVSPPIPRVALVGVWGLTFLFWCLMVQDSVALPLYMHQVLGLPTWQYGVVLATNGVGVLCMAYPLSGWLARQRPFLCLGCGVALFGAGAALNRLVSALPGLMANMWLSTLGEVMAAATMGSLIAALVPPQIRGRVFGVQHAVAALAMLLSPLAVGWLLARSTFGTVWSAMGVVGVVGLGVGLMVQRWYEQWMLRYQSAAAATGGTQC